MSQQFSILTYFSHHQQIQQLMKGNIAESLRKKLLNAAKMPDEILKAHDRNLAYNHSVIEYLTTYDVKPLQTLLAGDKQLKSGTLFWVETSILFKGCGDAWEAVNYNGKKPSYFNFKIEFPEFGDKTVIGELNAEHLYTTSAVDQLSRKKKKFLFGHIQEINVNTIVVRTLLIGDRVVHGDFMQLYEPERLELKVYEIDEFRDTKTVKYNDPTLDINRNKSITEKQIKQYFGEIINEGNADKDWGGEQSDLFTTHLHINGEQFRAAFIFKGPSKFHKMEVSDLGKNGDQIVRLFDEPVDIFVLQHCHYITPRVIKTMDVFANQINRQRMYCIIDGIDTLRIFKAYRKI